METTGKARESLKQWLKETKPVTFEILGTTFNFSTLASFKYLPNSMKWGVLQDFFDSVDIYVDVIQNEVARSFYYSISTKPMSNDITCYPDKSRPEARIEAIKKANEIYNLN